jgi:superfamily I DNA/RNA helicase
MWNFRSTQALVELQHRFAQMLDPAAEKAVSQAVSDITEQPAQIWSFSSPHREAKTVAAFIAADIQTSGCSPADYALVALLQRAMIRTCGRSSAWSCEGRASRG